MNEYELDEWLSQEAEGIAECNSSFFGPGCDRPPCEGDIASAIRGLCIAYGERHSAWRRAEVEQWAQGICEDGAHDAMQNYRETHEVGNVADCLWDNPDFKYGVEYGILIAIAHIFEDEGE